MKATQAILITSLFLGSGNAFAQSVKKQTAAIVTLGGAANWNVKDGGSSFGPTAAVEVTPIEPIEKWLELEAGVTPLFSIHTTEWLSEHSKRTPRGALFHNASVWPWLV